MFAALLPLAGKLLRSRGFWYVAVAVVAVLGVYLYALPWARDRFGRGGQAVDRAGETIKDIDTALKEVASKDETIAALSRQIQKEHEAAVAAVARATALQGQIDRSSTRADELARRVAELEAQRRALKPVTTLQEAKSVLEDLGYRPSLTARP